MRNEKECQIDRMLLEDLMCILQQKRIVAVPSLEEGNIGHRSNRHSHNNILQLSSLSTSEVIPDQKSESFWSVNRLAGVGTNQILHFGMSCWAFEALSQIDHYGWVYLPHRSELRQAKSTQAYYALAGNEGHCLVSLHCWDFPRP